MPKSLLRALTIALLAVVVLTACGATPSFRGTVLDPPRTIPDFTLTDQRGQPFRLSDQRGQVVLLFFGYSHCPDVCPTTLATWKRVHATLGPDAERVRFAFVTVDPQRDTPERLRQHVELFNPDFVGLTGSQAALEPVYETFGVYHEKDAAGQSAAGYLVAHTSSVFVVDPDGQWRLKFSYGTPVEDIVHDVKLVLD